MSDDDTDTSTEDARRAVIAPVAERVRAARKARGMPRRVLSDRSGVSPRYLAQLEAGEGNISIVLLERVARALETSLEALICDDTGLDPDALDVARRYAAASARTRAAVDRALAAEEGAQAPLRVCLIGLRGAGKSTLGPLLADSLGVPFNDLGDWVARETGLPVAEVLKLYGREGYRRLEEEALERLLAQDGPMVLAVSGGFVEREAGYARLLEQCHTIWLRCSVAEHLARLGAKGGPVPEARDLERLLQERGARLARADAVVDTGGRTRRDAAAELARQVAALRDAPAA
ncbi:shikimate kinase [Sulfitobacter sp. HNIBRBA3233]|uniref:shikimate kinase n=1 Tax=Sulfitobacter marinivivus TaxID=3158558 RepID=UPI0032DE908C